MPIYIFSIAIYEWVYGIWILKKFELKCVSRLWLQEAKWSLITYLDQFALGWSLIRESVHDNSNEIISIRVEDGGVVFWFFRFQSRTHAEFVIYLPCKTLLRILINLFIDNNLFFILNHRNKNHFFIEEYFLVYPLYAEYVWML